MIKLISSSIFICIIHFSFTQNQKIGILSGNVVDSTSKKGIDYASVRLFSVKDSMVKSGVYTDAKGKIKLDEIPLGNYYIKISFLGYKVKVVENVVFTDEKPNKDIGEIFLQLDEAKNLEEVKVLGKKENVLNDIDKKVYDVGEDIAVRGGTAIDILNNIPSIEIDQDGKISLRGDANVTILIDGRPSSLAGGNGKSFLDAFPANSIERIEVVTNPSAKYDPDGTSGIINIVLKKNKLKGINGNVALSAGSGNVYNASAALSYRTAKLNVYGTYSYRYYEGSRDYQSHLVRTFDSSVFVLDQNRIGTDLMENHTAKIGSDFFLNDRNTLGFSVATNLGDRERTGDLINLQYDGSSNLDRSWQRASSDPSSNRNYDLNGNYKIDFKKEKGNIIFDANFSKGDESNEGEYHEMYLTTFGQTDNTSDLFQRLNNKSIYNVSTFQTDMVRNINKTMKFELGGKSILRYSHVDTYSETQDKSTKEYNADTIANFNYEYVEQIFSLYSSFAQQIKKFKYQGGLRFEKALQAPNLLSDSISYRNEYYNVFPSVFLKYELNKENELSLSYSKRINRPTADNLNPFTSYADPFNLRMGNPALKPEYINSFDFGYSLSRKKINLTFSAFYRQTQSVITRIKNYYDNGTTSVSYGNIDNSESFGPEIVLIYKPFPWMKNLISANGNNVRYTDDTPGYNWNNSGFYWGVKYAGTFDYWKKTATFQINARYNSPIITAQGKVQPRAQLDLSTDKSFKKGNWSVGLRLTDVFNTQEFRLDIEQPTAIQNARFKQNTRRIYVNLNYKFGKYDIKKSRNGGDGGGFDF